MDNMGEQAGSEREGEGEGESSLRMPFLPISIMWFATDPAVTYTPLFQASEAGSVTAPPCSW